MEDKAGCELPREPAGVDLLWSAGVPKHCVHSQDSRMEDGGWRMEEGLRESAHGGKQKNQSTLGWTSLKQRLL